MYPHTPSQIPNAPSHVEKVLGKMGLGQSGPTVQNCTIPHHIIIQYHSALVYSRVILNNCVANPSCSITQQQILAQPLTDEDLKQANNQDKD